MNIRELAFSYGKAWAERDLDAIMALHTDDTVFQLHGDNRSPAVGAAAVRAAIGAMLAQSPDLGFEPKRTYLGEAHMVFEYVMTGTVAGKPFACDGVDVLAIREGRVARKDTYADWVVYTRQVDAQ